MTLILVVARSDLFLGMAEEIADAIFWMASPGASFMTGSR